MTAEPDDRGATGGAPLWIAAPLRVEALAVRGAVPGARVLRTGMGPLRAQRAAARLRAGSARALAVAGVCGALDDRFAPGDVLVASALLAPDGERIALDGEPLRAALARLGIASQAATIAGVPTLAAGARREDLLASGADAVDMESFWLAEAAAGRPFAVLRVVLDGPSAELWRPDLPVRLVSVLRRLRAAAPALGAWAAAGPVRPVFTAPRFREPVALARGA